MPDLDPAQVNAFLADVFPSAARDGFRCESLGTRTATARWVLKSSELRPGGLISGPTMFGLADCALWFASFTELGLEAMAVTSELSIRFLRPAQGGDLLALATLDSVGRRQIVGSIVLWVDDPDRPVAVAQGTYSRPRSS